MSLPVVGQFAFLVSVIGRASFCYPILSVDNFFCSLCFFLFLLDLMFSGLSVCVSY
jgi:hypothetical protein